MADPNQENMQEHLERTTEALRAIAMFASKDVKEYPRLFFTTDVLGPCAPTSRSCRRSGTAPCWKSRRRCCGSRSL
ncbi:hypothetical protein NIA69_02605 [Gemmiger formicilis]|nr:hypothetical protein [Gemmiger formicilis]